MNDRRSVIVVYEELQINIIRHISWGLKVNFNEHLCHTEGTNEGIPCTGLGAEDKQLGGRETPQ